MRNAISWGLFAVAAVGLAPAANAAERKTVTAVAKVDGKTKTIDGKVYSLVAVRLDLSVHLLGSGLGSPVLVLSGHDGRAELEDGDKEGELSGTTGPKLLWLRLPDDGAVEVVWGALAPAKGTDAELRKQLVDAGYVPFKAEVKTMPVVKAGTAKELTAALDDLAKPAKRK